MKSALEYAPQELANSSSILTGLDYYKLTMSQFFYDKEPNVDATFTFHNRSTDRLADHIRPEQLQERLDDIRTRGFSDTDLRYIGSLTHTDGSKVFSGRYLRYLQRSSLPSVEVRLEGPRRDIAIRTTGRWALSTFWETIAMRETTALYNEGYLARNGLSRNRIYDEGNKRLDADIALLRKDPTLHILEFGTRRAYSPEWHRHVLGRLATEVPRNLIGTSNVGFAPLTGSQPRGTFAHEAPMGWAALADARGKDIRASHGKLLDAWRDYYGSDYSVALSDTFSTKFFYQDFGPHRAKDWKGIRHDSGDPYETGGAQIAMYRRYGLDPRDHQALFSDALNVEKALDLHRAFGGLLLDSYGIGTSLSANVGLRPRNHVMKATHFYDTQHYVDAEAVKLSDDAGKHTGSPALVHKYERTFTA